jgi:hypothetical protein
VGPRYSSVWTNSTVRGRQAIMLAVGVHENFYRDLAGYR